MNIAIIENDVVVNVIVAETLSIAQQIFTDSELVEITSANNIGLNWDRKSGNWRSPKPEYDCSWNETYNAWLTDEQIALIETESDTPVKQP
jgi:hypothetical protein